MYKVNLLENETILNSKELKDYDKAIKRVNELMSDLVEGRKIIVYEKNLINGKNLESGNFNKI